MMNQQKQHSRGDHAETTTSRAVAQPRSAHSLAARAYVPLLLAGCLLLANTPHAQQRGKADSFQRLGGPEAVTAGADEQGKADKSRDDFVVTGKVTDPAGQPLDGVTVSAGTGWNTLTGGGQATTGADGCYTLRFGPGIVGPGRVTYQVAVFNARKSGYVERNMSRHGNWRMSGHPEDADKSEKGTTHTVVLPNQPRELDFVMVPAASIRGRMVDTQGKPVVGQNLSVSGKLLPPGSGVYATRTTDDKGQFAFDGIPTFQPMWFHMFAKPDAKHEKGATLETSPSDFSEPRQYDVKLVYDTDARKLTVDHVAASGTETATP